MNLNVFRRSLYEELGGEPGVRRLVNAFYNILEEGRHPDSETLRQLVVMGRGIEHAREQQFAFLSGFLGGPQLYSQKHGHADVEMMHRHVHITPRAREIWLECMGMALDTVDARAIVKADLMSRFGRIANLLVNAPDEHG